MKRTELLWKAIAFSLAGMLVVLSAACSKGSDDNTPSIEWLLDYTVSSVGDVTVDQITYTDESGVAQTIPGEREFRLTLNAISGFTARMIVEGTATSGGVIAKIDATALDGSSDVITDFADDGESSGIPKDIRLVVELKLP
jgi:hypothetical protein